MAVGLDGLVARAEAITHEICAAAFGGLSPTDADEFVALVTEAYSLIQQARTVIFWA